MMRFLTRTMKSNTKISRSRQQDKTTDDESESEMKSVFLEAGNSETETPSCSVLLSILSHESSLTVCFY